MVELPNQNNQAWFLSDVASAIIEANNTHTALEDLTGVLNAYYTEPCLFKEYIKDAESVVNLLRDASQHRVRLYTGNGLNYEEVIKNLGMLNVFLPILLWRLEEWLISNDFSTT